MSDPAGYQPDPAYSGQYPSNPGFGGTQYPGYGAPMTPPTEQIPPYWQPGMGYPPNQPPPAPPPPRSPRWLWIAAAAAVVVVAGLVFVLVSVSSSSKRSTTVAPLPSSTSAAGTPRLPAPTRAPTSRVPIPAPFPSPTAPQEPGIPGGETTDPGVTETVVYTVTGEGRAINITYVDSGGVMQTEFNVALPWSKEVSLTAPAKNSASVAVVNVGRDVTCSVTVNGAQVRQRTGQGLTICTGIA
ncbi:MAG: MmpS family transport accessory protein [Mycobacteriaceae bacterium]